MTLTELAEYIRDELVCLEDFTVEEIRNKLDAVEYNLERMRLIIVDNMRED